MLLHRLIRSTASTHEGSQAQPQTNLCFQKEPPKIYFGCIKHYVLPLRLFFLRRFFSSSSLLALSLSLGLVLLVSDSEDTDPELISSDEELLCSLSLGITGCCCMMRRGMFFRYSRKLSVRPPRPIEVKKLMANRVFLGLSFGKMPSNESCIIGSDNLSFSLRRPRCSESSWKRILMKIRDDDVVCSSVSLM